MEKFSNTLKDHCFLPDDLDSLYLSVEECENTFPKSINDRTEEKVPERYFLRRLSMIERFVKEIENGNRLFLDSSRDIKTTTKPLKNYFGSLSSYLSVYSPKRIYTPHVEAFYEASIEVYEYDSFHNFFNTESIRKLDKFNNLIEKIRELISTKEFRKKIYSRSESFKRGFQSSKKYVDSLFQNNSRLLIIRIDFGFDSRKSFNEPTSGLNEAQSYIKKFFNNKRSKSLYSTAVGYIWRMEYGEEKGYHFHLFFFLDGSKSHKDAFLANQIGTDWKKVTNGIGIYHNCNASKRKYKRLCIGMISHYDQDSRKTLDHVLAYMHKLDQIVSIKLSKNTRTWGRGEMPKPRTNLAGRPRAIRS